MEVVLVVGGGIGCARAGTLFEKLVCGAEVLGMTYVAAKGTVHAKKIQKNPFNYD